MLTYQSLGNAEFFPTKVYTQSVSIEREIQKISFPLPETEYISKGYFSLNASAASGQVITYSSLTPEICSISGLRLNLLRTGNCSVTAIQAGTSTLTPVSVTASITIAGTVVTTKKAINCIRGEPQKKLPALIQGAQLGLRLKSK